MATKIYDRCWCGKKGGGDFVTNYVAGSSGMKGRVAQVSFCSEGHQDVYGGSGDMVALFHAGSVMLRGGSATSKKISKRRIRPITESDRDSEREMISVYVRNFGSSGRSMGYSPSGWW